MKKNCLACKREYQIPKCRRNKSKYCSTQCQYENQNKYKLCWMNCSECRVEFSLSPSHAKRNKNSFCSRVCVGKYYGKRRKFSGKDNPGWKGGVTPIHVSIRTSVKYAEWRTMIFERDDFICQICGQRGGELNADHIKELSKYPDSIFDLENGRTLCVSCHRKTDNYGWRAATL